MWYWDTGYCIRPLCAEQGINTNICTDPLPAPWLYQLTNVANMGDT